ncbi:M48 family metallopeptidase [Brevundimonas sp. BAL450]|uniref:M48 family metallopeptidase n=1 Tax=Brevundimonas TaxID=41275 RepID=UPI0006980575|nr:MULTISPECIES: M48 family metallopeptidase [Brevundimonas]MBG7616319.1 M48 family metallopeptidase [Brevundimonas sp. BAL450]
MFAKPRPRHGEKLEIDGLRLRLSVNRRARRVSVRIDARAGEAVVTAPSERAMPQAIDFALSRRTWIAEHLAKRTDSAPFAPGAEILFGGRPVRLIASGNAAAARLVPEHPDGPAIISGGEDDAFHRRVERLLRAEAKAALTARTQVHLERLDLKPVRVSIGDPASRWGSCSPHNRSIRYSWRVVMAPPEVLDYLAAHEVAHLVHADHSPAYWSVVHGLVGDHRPFRKWLRDHGPALHAAGRV